jgi:cytochrome c oxidase subunit 3
MASTTIPGFRQARRRGLAGHMEKTGDQGIEPGLLGLMVFVASEIMFFAAFFAAYFTFKAAAGPGNWPGLTIKGEHIEALNVGYATGLTVLLVSSSVTMQASIFAIRHDMRKAAAGLVTITFLLGTVFIAGQAREWLHLPFRVKDGVYPSLFYTITGFHGLHVIGGLVAMTFVLSKSVGGAFSADNHVMMESVSFYWHFVDVVWIGVFSTLYIIA